MSSWICAARAASSTSSSDALGRAKRRFSRTVAWKRYVSCETTPDRVGERLEREVAHVDAVDRDRALGRVVEPRDEVRAGRLPRARLADERRLRPGRHRERDVLERPRRVVVAEPDGVERDLATRLRQPLGALDDVDLVVEVLEDAVEQRE